MDNQPRPEDVPSGPVPVEVVGHPPAARPRKRSGLPLLLAIFVMLAFGGGLMLVVVFLLGGSLSSDSKVQEKYFSHARYGSQKVAIISVEGMILEADDGYIKKAIDQAAEDDKVKAVVLRINSPGGTTSGADYVYHHLCNLTAKTKKPLVVSMGGMAASGGYYVAMAVGSTPETVFAEPMTFTGSIGVILPHYNAAALMKEWGVEEDSVASHRLKNMGSFARAMSTEEREIFQALINEQFARFKEVIRSGRPKFEKDPEALDKLATGQIFTAEQALKAGLVDKIGFVEDAVDRAIALAKLNKDEVRVVKYKQPVSLSDLLLSGAAGSRRTAAQNTDWMSLLDLTAPRAYYLCTWIPSLIHPTALGR